MAVFTGTQFSGLNSDNNISLFLSCLNIPVGIGCLFERVALIDNRFNLARLDQFFKEK